MKRGVKLKVVVSVVALELRCTCRISPALECVWPIRQICWGRNEVHGQINGWTYNGWIGWMDGLIDRLNA